LAKRVAQGGDLRHLERQRAAIREEDGGVIQPGGIAGERAGPGDLLQAEDAPRSGAQLRCAALLREEPQPDDFGIKLHRTLQIGDFQADHAHLDGRVQGSGRMDS